MKRKIFELKSFPLAIGLLIFLLFLTFGNSCKDPDERDPINLTVNVSQADVYEKSFLGIGAQWDSYNYVDANLSTSDFNLIIKRITWMRPSVVRVMMLTKWCYNNGVYTWDSPEMIQLFRVLDVCKEKGINVILTDWGCGTPGHPERDWLKVPGIDDATDPNYALAIGTYLDYFVNTKDYTNIRYFVMGNEPNLEIIEWAMWKTGLLNVHSEMHNRGLDTQILLTGCDESGGNSWHLQAVDELNTTLDAYDYHGYPQDETVKSGELETVILDKNQYILTNDPLGAEKPVIIGEAGVTPLSDMDNFDYGVKMADYAIQAMNAGTSAISAWMLDDNSYPGFNNGLWKDKSNNFETRNWFFVWSLFCRLFPDGTYIYKLNQPDPLVRLTVAKLPDGGWSICAVNRADNPAKITLSLPGTGTKTLYRYLYKEDNLEIDEDGFPIPASIVEQNFAEEIEITVSVNSVVFMSSVAPD